MNSPSSFPTFTVVCLCYNQARFLRQALDSIPAQEYPGRVQLLFVDDASTDGSAGVGQEWLREHPQIDHQTIILTQNLGNCRAFNRALALADGEYIIDLAADDQLAPGRLAAHARMLIENSETAFVYGDAWYVNADGKRLYRQSDRVPLAPEGDVFARLFQGNFICPSTVTFRTEALRQLGGYDERLAFEDFDVWLRLARQGPVRYLPEIASLHRVSPGSLSGRFYNGTHPKMARSIVLIGKKALALARTDVERRAIAGWLLFQARLAAYTGYPVALKALGKLYRQASGKPLHGFRLLRLLSGLNMGWAYRLYLKVRY